MSSEQLYANGRIAVLSTKLLTKDKFVRLAECGTLAEALRVLAELGFGESAQPNDYEQVLRRETDAALGAIKELCTNGKVLGYLLCKYNYHNAKALMKGKYMRRDCLSLCFESATYPPEQMRDDFVSDNYRRYSRLMAEACDAVDTAFANGERNPQKIDMILDKACFAEMLRLAHASLCPLAVKLCDLQINCTNLTLAQRFKRAGFSAEALNEWLVAGGSISREKIAGYFEGTQSANDFPEQYRALFGSENAFATLRNKLVADYADPLTVQPALEYFFAKTDEIDLIRLILVGVKNGADKNKLKDKINQCLTK